MKTTKHNPPTIAQIRQAGHKVRVIHRFFNEQLDKGVGPINIPYDGEPQITEIHLTMNGKTTIGIAYRAEGDQYNRTLGNRIALGRAWKEMHKEKVIPMSMRIR